MFPIVMVTAPDLFNRRWISNLTRGTGDMPLISPLFVAEQGPGVQIVDIRPQDEATGVLGFIPGSSFLGIEKLKQLARDSAVTSPLVIVSATGDSSAKVARQLEESGLEQVAAMAGGLAEWRALGISTSRDPAGVRDALYGATEAESGSGPLTLEQVREHVGDPRSVRWLKLSSMIAQGRLSCIDGRDERGVIGTPGGDGGEFLLELAAIEQVTGRRLDEETVRRVLLFHLDTFGHFYMHTDVHAFEVLTAALKADPAVKPSSIEVTQLEDWYEFLHRGSDGAPQGASQGLQETLLEHLVNPAHLGCGHIRLMLQHGDEYGIRSGLVLSFLRAFFRLWWEGAPEVSLTVLPGDHEEGAVVNVRLSEGVWSLSRIPLISPACGGRQMFVNHPDVSSYLRSRTVEFLVREKGPLGIEAAQEGALQEVVDELAARQLGVTVGYLAKGLPIFDVVFAVDGTFDVRG